MRIRRSSVPFWVVMALAGTLSAGQAQEPQKGGTLHILATGEPDHMDPALAGMVPTNNLMRAISRQLISYEASTDENLAIKPVGDLATDVPQPTDNGLTYTFKLRQGAKWNAPSGARQITSTDVERGFKRLCNPHLQGRRLLISPRSSRVSPSSVTDSPRSSRPPRR
jgi:peptide/nickel transport system substrate-binding protein